MNSNNTTNILIPVACALAFYCLLRFAQSVYNSLTSPLRDMPGPPSPSFVLGNFKAMAEDSSLTSQWRDQFGRNFRFRSLFGRMELHTSDIKAVNHIVMNNAVYEKVPSNLDVSKYLLGNGVFSVEKEEHKRQRRIMNQAFAPSQIRLLTEMFTEKAIRLRDIWANQLIGKPEGATLDVSAWFRRVTLDVTIGEAGNLISAYIGFNYSFNSLTAHAHEQPNQMQDAFTRLIHSPRAQLYAGFRTAQAMAPILKFVPVPGRQVANDARDTMKRIADHIISGSKAELAAEAQSKDTAASASLKGKRDLLSVLLKSNIAAEALPESQRMSDAELAAQIPTFLFAGHETTSTAASWTLHALSLHPTVQTKLRDDLLTLATTENPTMDELNALPYLECVVRETMRLYAPVHFAQRVVVQDDVIPLSNTYIDKRGKEHQSLVMRQGQVIHVPILAVNTDPEIWGEDALKFIPERWENPQALPAASSSIPGVYTHLLTFFGGVHNCIGYRFALVELKAIIFTLVRAFEFAPAVPSEDVVPQAVGLISRPAVVGKDMSKKAGLPLVIKAYNADGY
ncbi:cytochrome P450 [Roridomyces roridus]|uniref:Cytochrome P450 n=1 Tax=Roridomyces roridus TaxID=1738132 RepID=A0AAD7CL59_9AGAR|nr:cytochrome P450 [Roridomyces roridus]